MEAKTYNFKAGFCATQGELTYLQSKELLKQLKSLKIDSIEDVTKMTIADLITAISESDLVPALLSVILSADSEYTDYTKLTISEITEVFEDFFIFNPALQKLFGIGKNVLNSTPISTSN